MAGRLVASEGHLGEWMDGERDAGEEEKMSRDVPKGQGWCIIAERAQDITRMSWNWIQVLSMS